VRSARLKSQILSLAETVAQSSAAAAARCSKLRKNWVWDNCSGIHRVIPNAHAEGGRVRDLTMRVYHHGRNRDTNECLQLQENVISRSHSTKCHKKFIAANFFSPLHSDIT